MLLPWTAHLYTALGAGCALFAAVAVIDGDFRTAFIWLAVQVFIDSTDGLLARAVHVKERLPWFDGALLDNIIDYITYVFVPALMLVRVDLVPQGWAPWIGAAMLLSSGYGFSRTDAKVEQGGEHFFTGFPSYWNIVIFYMYVWRLSPVVNAAILVALVVLVFVPIRYVYPSRTGAFQSVTIILGFVWAAIAAWMVYRLPATDGPWLLLSLMFPAYYVALSLWLCLRSSSSS